MSTEPSPPPRPVPPAGGRMMGSSGLEQVTKGAARTQAAAQSLFPGMQLARAVRAIRHPSAHGLTEEQEAVARSLRQQSDVATEEVARRAPPGEWEGAQSFAALWYADRLGGHPLAEQRPPQHEENPDHLFLAAAELLDREPEALGSRESGAAARDQLHRWQMDLQAGRRWKEGAFQTVLPRNWSPARSDPAQTEQFAQASHWRDWLDGACIPPSGASPTILNRMKVWPKLPDLLRNVPTGIPIRFVIRTDQASRHAVYVVLENDPDDPQAMFLEIWNTGWGSVPAGSDRIHPAVRLHLENRLDAARALLALDAAEHVYHENLPLIKVLASLTCPGSQLERVKAGKEGTQQVLEMAAESGRLTYPAGEPVKAQRSGSCVAKGLRQWMQHALGGSQNSEGRRLMALLDLVASSALAIEYPPQADSEIRELRRWLAGITAGYRWWKAVSRETDPQELLLRSAATRAPLLSAQRAAAATEQAYQPSAFTSPAAEALYSGASQELDPGLRLDRICARLRSLAIQGDFLELEELWKLIEPWRDQNPAQLLALAIYEDNVQGPTNKAECWTPDIVEYEIWDTGLTLWLAIEQIQSAGPQNVELADQMIEAGEAALKALRAVISFTPRPGHSEAAWVHADAVWQRLPTFGDRIGVWPTFQGIEDLGTAKTHLAMAMNKLLQVWTISRGLREQFPLIDFTQSPGRLLGRIGRAIRSNPLTPEIHAEFLAVQKLIQACDFPISLLERAERSVRAAPGGRIAPSFFQRLHRISDLTERTGMLRSTPLPSSKAQDTLLLARGLMSGTAMETAGLPALLTSSVASGQPLLALRHMRCWTPPLGTGAPPQVQGDLFALGGLEAWNSWLDGAIDHVEAMGTPGEDRERDRLDLGLPDLGPMAHHLLLGMPLPLDGPHMQLLEKWARLLDLAAPHSPVLTAAAAAVRLQRLLSISLSTGRLLPLSEESVLGDLQTLFSECPWDGWNEQGLAQSFCHQWGALREEQGFIDPWTISLVRSGGEVVEIDLHHAQPLQKIEDSPAQRALNKVSLPLGWHRLRPPTFGQVLTHETPNGEQIQIRTERNAPLVEWDSSFGGKERGALLRPPGQQPAKNASSAECVAALLPAWDLSAEARLATQQTLPLHSDQILWYGDRWPQSDSDWAALKAERAHLPGIFRSAPIIQTRRSTTRLLRAGPQSREYGLVATGTLQETGRLVRAGGRECLRFPDGEEIPLVGHTRWGALSVIGQTGTNGRVCLEDVAMQGTPVRGTIRGTGMASQLDLDSGWTVAPEAFADLPVSLEAVIGGSERDPRTIAVPLVRKSPSGGQELGLLIGRPAGTGAGGAGEMMILRVRPTGDLEVEPGTRWEGVIEMVAHLARYAPSVLPRVVQALADAAPRVSFQSREALLERLRQLALEGGADLQAALREARLAFSTTPNEGASIRARRALLARRGIELMPPATPAGEPPAAVEGRIRSLSSSPVLSDDLELLGIAKEALSRGELEPAQQALSQLVDSLQAQQHTTQNEVELAFGSLSSQDAALLQARFGLDPSAILNGWFQAEQSASPQPWAHLLRGVSPSAQMSIQQSLTRLMVNTLRLRAAVDLAEQLDSEAAMGSSVKRLEAFETRVAGRLPLSQLRQEWLFGILGRPQQSEILERWASGEGGPRQLLKVGMGGGKTSFLNPAIAFEMAHQNSLSNPKSPQAVLVVVPDALEEDAKHLCYQQGWDLMGASMPFVGSKSSAQQVVEAAREAANRALPLTLTQSAWNFAWLELIHRIETSSGPEALRARAQLSVLASASILLDEADQALALDQSYNLESQAPQPLPPFLLQALDRFIALRAEQDRPLLAPLDRQEQLDYLIGLAPQDWDLRQAQRVAEAVIDRHPLDELDESGAEAMAAGALLISRARATAQELKDEKSAYGPATSHSLEVVPYQSAFWPTSQKFSDPALIAMLTLAQTEDPDFWSAERVRELQQRLRDWVRSAPQLKQRLQEVGLSSEVRTDWQQLQAVLQSNRAARLQIGALLCQTSVTTAGRVIKLAASGAPLRARRCLAATGTPPPAAQTPTSLAGALPLAPPAPRLGPDVLSVGQILRASSLESALHQTNPHILIDPAGLLDRDEAAQVGLRMAQALVRSGAESRPPVVLTWSNGARDAAPQLERILPSGVSDTAPSQAALAQLPKVAVYQQAQCRGTDLKPRQGERGLLYLDDVIPLRDLQQAAARLRGLPATTGSTGLQSLVIAIGPDLAQQIDAYRVHYPTTGDDLAILRTLCNQTERSRDALLIPELLKQDLANLRQAAGLWSFTTTSPPDPQLAAALQEALHDEFHYPSLRELSHSSQDGESQKRRLLEQAQRFEDLLGRVLSDQPELEQIWEGLQVWRSRLLETPDPLFVRPDTTVAQAGVARTLEEAQEQQIQQEQQIEAQIQQSLAPLRNAAAERTPEELARERLWREASWDPATREIRGALQRGALVRDVGILGFNAYWEAKGGSADDELIPPSLAVSPAALMPLGAPLSFDDPLRLEPQLLHTKTADGWKSALIAPQEASEMQFAHPQQWQEAATQGMLLLTSLSGSPLTGMLGPTLGDEHRVLIRLGSDKDFRNHLEGIVRSTRQLRACFGAPIPPLVAADQEREELAWFGSHRRWSQVWLEMSPRHLRPGRLETLRRVGL